MSPTLMSREAITTSGFYTNHDKKPVKVKLFFIH